VDYVISGVLTVNGWSYICSLDVTNCGLVAIVRLVNGDLHNALNILQVVALFLMFWADRWDNTICIFSSCSQSW
jgi:hypothetical protein